MTESALSSSNTPGHPESSGPTVPSAESVAAIITRRARYIVAMLISAVVFYALGWKIAAPPPEVSGVSLLLWSSTHGLVAALGLTGLLVATAMVCTLIVHPDHPHMGLFCALVGMMALSARAGTDHLLIYYAQQSGPTHFANICEMLAVEAVQWAIVFLVAEMFVRLVHDRYFANTQWITRSGPGLAMDAAQRFATARAAMGVSLVVSQTLGTTKMRRRIGAPLAMLYSGLVAYVLLYALMQSELKGQVFFACAVAFFLSTANAYLAFPRVPALAFFLAVPVTGAVGYFLGRHDMGIYPGYPGSFMLRALPIDLMAAGVPGAILGYYAAIRWSLHSEEGEVS